MKKKIDYRQAWAEAKPLMWAHRRTLAIGFALMLVGRAAGFVGPASTKFLLDDVVGKRRFDVLLPLALAVGVAALVSAAASFVYLNWQMTLATLALLAIFGVGMAYAFITLRPIFRERSVITAEVSGRLGQAFGAARAT